MLLYCVSIEYIPSALAKSHLPGAPLEWLVITVPTLCKTPMQCILSNPMHWPSSCLRCTLYIKRCKRYIAHCTLYIAHCTLYIAHCTLYIAHCTLYIAHCILHTLHNVYSTLDTVSFIQHTAVPFPWGSLDESFESLLHPTTSSLIYTPGCQAGINTALPLCTNNFSISTLLLYHSNTLQYELLPKSLKLQDMAK